MYCLPILFPSRISLLFTEIKGGLDEETYTTVLSDHLRRLRERNREGAYRRGHPDQGDFRVSEIHHTAKFCPTRVLGEPCHGKVDMKVTESGNTNRKN